MNLLTGTARRVALFLVVLCVGVVFSPPGISSSPWSALTILRNTVSSGEPEQSAPCSIEYFEAHPERPGIKLVWCVFADKDIEGFQIYRTSERDAALVVVNKRGLIPAWHQSCTDTDVAPATNYRYVLGVVFEDGTESLSEPAAARSPDKAVPLPDRALAEARLDQPK